jgi:hypothetical protein
MTDLHETSDPKHPTQIDIVGWIFVAFVVVLTAIAAMVVYHGNRAMFASTPVSHVAGSRG